MSDNHWQTELERLQTRERTSRAILGVGPEASKDEIRWAFRRCSLAHHPDRNNGDAEAARRFNLAHCAYKFLTEGEGCTALDEADDPAGTPTSPRRRPGNQWTYWCWWWQSYCAK